MTELNEVRMDARPQPFKARSSRRFRSMCIVVAAVAVGATACGSSSPSAGSTSTSSTGSTTTTTSLTGAAAPTTTIAANPTHVGGTQSLAQTALNPAMQVKLAQVIDPAQNAPQFAGPLGGDRFVGVQLRVTIGSGGSFSDDPVADTLVADANGNLYSADPTQLQGCVPFVSGGITLSANKSSTGCVTFQLPLNSAIALVKFTPGSANYGVTTATWQVP